MNIKTVSLGVAILLAAAAPAAAQAQSAEQRITADQLQVAVFNRPGPNWEKRAEAASLLLAHRNLYRALAEDGQILCSGRFLGEPGLGISFFACGADAVAIRQRLEADPAVTNGYVALQFRNFLRSFAPPCPAPTSSKEKRHDH